MNEPITFTEPGYAVLDVEKNSVLCTEWGNLAIFSVKAIAEAVVRKSSAKCKVVPVTITPIKEH